MTKTKQKLSPKAREDLALSLLDDLIQACYGALLEQVQKTAKLGDWLKMIELRKKLAPDEKPNAELWKKLDKVRREMLKTAPQASEDATDKPAPRVTGKHKQKQVAVK